LAVVVLVVVLVLLLLLLLSLQLPSMVLQASLSERRLVLPNFSKP